jgi:hypothetical protein
MKRSIFSHNLFVRSLATPYPNTFLLRAGSENSIKHVHVTWSSVHPDSHALVANGVFDFMVVGPSTCSLFDLYARV